MPLSMMESSVMSKTTSKMKSIAQKFYEDILITSLSSKIFYNFPEKYSLPILQYDINYEISKYSFYEEL